MESESNSSWRIRSKREALVVLIGLIAWGALSILFAWISWDKDSCTRAFVGEDSFGRLVLCRFMPTSN
jgi:hypothetical protein